MILTIDFETAYSQDYSLTRMTAAEYVLSPMFQVLMCTCKIDDEPVEVHFGKDQVAARFSQIDWDNTDLLAHNINFDGSIVKWVFGYEPRLYLCTLSMARATTHWVVGKSSLKEVSAYLNLPPKGTEVVNAKGKWLRDFTREELIKYAEYCIRDNENCYSIYTRLKHLFTDVELRVIDLVARMHILPQVLLNSNVLAEHLADVRSQKQAALDAVGYVDPGVFSSQTRFAALLEEHGVEVPVKQSPATGKAIPALAKGDKEFNELCKNPDLPVYVQALLAARVSAKSTLSETRTERLLALSRLDWRHYGTGWLATPLRYSGARTHRFSGDDRINLQNLPRGSQLRASIEAPPGYRILARDASQIEARLVAWMAGCRPLLDAFAIGEDVYSSFATMIYGRNITKADKLERFIGKTGVLGLGYSCGHVKFRHMLHIGAGGLSAQVDEDEAKRIVYAYRNIYHEIPRLWKSADGLIDEVMEKSGIEFGPNYNPPFSPHIPVKAGHDSVWLPSGLCLSYPGLHYERDPDTLERQAWYKNTYNGQAKLYGGKLIENISQALARILITDIAVRVYNNTSYHPFLSTHDSLCFCVPEGEVEGWDKYLEREFAYVPGWAAGLPLASEGGWGKDMLSAERQKND